MEDKSKDDLYWDMFRQTGSICAFLLYLIRSGDKSSANFHRNGIESKAMKEISSPT